MRNQSRRPESKKCFLEAKEIWDTLVKKYDLDLVKWAFNRKLNWERERTKLNKEKKALELQLKEVNDELK